MNRGQWLREVRRGDFPAGLRIARATLLLLPMTTEGTITATNTEMAELTGLPVRTLARHLAKAVDAGWLDRIARGGVGARSRYQAALPGVCHEWPTPQGDSAPHVAYSEARECTTNGRTSEPESTHSRPERVCHLVAESIEDSANASEHGALDQGRDRRPDHDGSRDAPDQQHQEQRTDEAAPDTTTTVADSPNTSGTEPNCSECRRRTTMGDNSGCHRLTAGQYCPFPQLDIRAS